jgi:transcriptional regulator with XRE-family HTH domain
MKENKTSEIDLTRKALEGARAVKRYIEESKVDINELAKKTKISVSSIKAYLKLRTSPRPATIAKIEEALGEELQLSLKY